MKSDSACKLPLIRLGRILSNFITKSTIRPFGLRICTVERFVNDVALDCPEVVYQSVLIPCRFQFRGKLHCPLIHVNLLKIGHKNNLSTPKNGNTLLDFNAEFSKIFCIFRCNLLKLLSHWSIVNFKLWHQRKLLKYVLSQLSCFLNKFYLENFDVWQKCQVS